MIPWLGPVTVQSTYVMQVSDHAGERDAIRYVKVTHRRDVGRARTLTVVVRPLYANLGRLVSDMEILERECLAALGSVAAVFDERFALEELGKTWFLWTVRKWPRKGSWTLHGGSEISGLTWRSQNSHQNWRLMRLPLRQPSCAVVLKGL